MADYANLSLRGWRQAPHTLGALSRSDVVRMPPWAFADVPKQDPSRRPCCRAIRQVAKLGTAERVVRQAVLSELVSPVLVAITGNSRRTRGHNRTTAATGRGRWVSAPAHLRHFAPRLPASLLFFGTGPIRCEQALCSTGSGAIACRTGEHWLKTGESARLIYPQPRSSGRVTLPIVCAMFSKWTYVPQARCVTRYPRRE
jgi:hypothetical protein